MDRRGIAEELVTIAKVLVSTDPEMQSGSVPHKIDTTLMRSFSKAIASVFNRLKWGASYSVHENRIDFNVWLTSEFPDAFAQTKKRIEKLIKQWGRKEPEGPVENMPGSHDYSRGQGGMKYRWK